MEHQSQSESESEYIQIPIENTQKAFFLKKYSDEELNVDAINARFKTEINLSDLNSYKKIVKPFEDFRSIISKLLSEGRCLRSIAEETGLTSRRIQSLFAQSLTQGLLSLQQQAISHNMPINQSEIQFLFNKVTKRFAQGVGNIDQITQKAPQFSKIFNLSTRRTKQESSKGVNLSDLLKFLFNEKSMFRLSSSNRSEVSKSGYQKHIPSIHQIDKRSHFLQLQAMSQRPQSQSFRLNSIVTNQQTRGYYFTQGICNDKFRTLLARLLREIIDNKVMVNKECQNHNVQRDTFLEKIIVLKKNPKISNIRFSEFIDSINNKQEILLAQLMLKMIEKNHKIEDLNEIGGSKRQALIYEQNAGKFRKILQNFLQKSKNTQYSLQKDKTKPNSLPQNPQDSKIKQEPKEKKQKPNRKTQLPLVQLRETKIQREVADQLRSVCTTINKKLIFLQGCLSYRIDSSKLFSKVKTLIYASTSSNKINDLLMSELEKPEKCVIIRQLLISLKNQINEKFQKRYSNQKEKLGEFDKINGILVKDLINYYEKYLERMPTNFYTMIDPKPSLKRVKTVQQRIRDIVQRKINERNLGVTSVLTKKQEESQQDFGECKQHLRKIQGYCSLCYCKVCNQCYILPNSSHHGHPVYDIEEFTKDFEQKIVSAKSNLIEFDKKNETLLLETRKVGLSLDHNATLVQNLSEDYFGKLFSSLENRKAYFMKRLREVFKKKKEALESFQINCVEKQEASKHLNQLLSQKSARQLIEDAQVINEDLKKMTAPFEKRDIQEYEEISRELKHEEQRQEAKQLVVAFKEYIAKGSQITDRIRQ